MPLDKSAKYKKGNIYVSSKIETHKEISDVVSLDKYRLLISFINKGFAILNLQDKSITKVAIRGTE